jgi:hypothetical protein
VKLDKVAAFPEENQIGDAFDKNAADQGKVWSCSTGRAGESYQQIGEARTAKMCARLKGESWKSEEESQFLSFATRHLLHFWSGRNFAAITNVSGTVMGIFLGQKAG